MYLDRTRFSPELSYQANRYRHLSPDDGPLLSLSETCQPGDVLKEVGFSLSLAERSGIRFLRPALSRGPKAHSRQF